MVSGIVETPHDLLFIYLGFFFFWTVFFFGLLILEGKNTATDTHTHTHTHTHTFRDLYMTLGEGKSPLGYGGLGRQASQVFRAHSHWQISKQKTQHHSANTHNTHTHTYTCQNTKQHTTTPPTTTHTHAYILTTLLMVLHCTNSLNSDFVISLM